MLLVAILSPNVGELDLTWYVVDADLALLDQLTDVGEPQGHVLCASTVGLVPDEQNAISYIASAAATSCASIVDMAV